MLKTYLATALILLATAVPAGAHAPATERTRMREAVVAFLAHEGSPCAPHTTLTPGLRRGDWARATIACKDTDDATVFLKRDRRGWRVVSLGTAWAPGELAKLGVPPALQ